MSLRILAAGIGCHFHLLRAAGRAAPGREARRGPPRKT